ncbi:MAG: hypothetical protein AB7P40_11605 [Chloroflexota bacterium]
MTAFQVVGEDAYELEYQRAGQQYAVNYHRDGREYIFVFVEPGGRTRFERYVIRQ